MTRDQIKEKIEDLILEYAYVDPYDVYGIRLSEYGYEIAVEEIMKLWDQEELRSIKENAKLEGL